MSSRIFDRDTLLDLTVNVIPLAILGFFIVVFLVYNPGPFAWDSVASTLQIAIVATTFVLLAVLTYYAGKAIAGDEKKIGAHAETATFDPDAQADEHTEADDQDETDGELPEGEDDASESDEE